MNILLLLLLSNELLRLPNEGLDFDSYLMIETARGEDMDLRWDLLHHLDVLINISQRYSTPPNQCQKLSLPSLNADELDISPLVSSLLDEAMKAMRPCAISTPLHCFWDGSLALGPFPAFKHPALAYAANFFPGFIAPEISWKNFNPLGLLNRLEALGFSDLPTQMINTIGNGYTRLRCLNPAHPFCPENSDYHEDFCRLVEEITKRNVSGILPSKLESHQYISDEQNYVVAEDDSLCSLYGSLIQDLIEQSGNRALLRSVGHLLTPLTPNEVYCNHFLTPPFNATLLTNQTIRSFIFLKPNIELDDFLDKMAEANDICLTIRIREKYFNFSYCSKPLDNAASIQYSFRHLLYISLPWILEMN